MSRPGPIRMLMVCAFVLLALHFAHTVFGLGGHDSQLFNTYVYDGLMIAAAVLCLSRAALIQAERGAWLAFGIALASYAAGEIYWSVAIGDDPAPPIPSPADLLYLGFYPPAYVGVVLLARARLREFRSSLWLDGVIGALAVAAVAVAVLFDSVLSATEGSPEVVAVTMAYPLADLLLLSIIAALAAVTGWQLGGNAAVVAGSLVVAAIADGTYLAQSAAGTYQEGYPIDSAWLTANLLLGCAAWLPSRAPRPLRLDRLRLVAAPVLFGLTAIAVLLSGIFGGSHPSAAILSSAVLLAVIGRVVLSFRENLRLLATSREQALCDPLTGLRNRRAMMEDLPHTIERAREREPQVLVLMDLNGFKAYNDSYGHLAGDALLTRVATNLARSVAGSGQAYRLGGDEFCAAVELRGRTAGDVAADTAAALLEHGDGFTIGACFGTALLPSEARDAHSALRIADQRLYAHKADRSRRPDPGTGEALAALVERSPDLAGQSQVAQLAQRVAARLGACTDSLNGAAELRDIGKLAVPDAILRKSTPLEPAEREFLRQEPAVAQRLLSATPSLEQTARIVRAVHENWDGSGYPDGLRGPEIPREACIIAVCDAFEAMIADRPHGTAMTPAQALAQLRRHAGTRFDPEIVEAFCREVAAEGVRLRTPAG